MGEAEQVKRGLTLNDVERMANAVSIDGGLLAVALRPAPLDQHAVIHA